ncbi:MAG: hypothetical protein ACI3Z7_00820 [Candidatus Aphodosoma sp.]
MKLQEKLCLLIIGCILALNVAAQDVFYGEVGLTGGGGFVLGDVNGMLFRYMRPLGGGFVKYKFNGHYELRLQIDGGQLGAGYVSDVFRMRDYVGVQFLGEFNFFNYGARRWEAHRTWVTPTIVAGIGAVFFDGKVTPTVPLGLGVKFKLSNRVNVGAYWTVAKTFSDAVDFVDDPIGLNKGVWNNRDWYSTAQVYLSVNFFKICVPCRNGVQVKKKR